MTSRRLLLACIVALAACHRSTGAKIAELGECVATIAPRTRTVVPPSPLEPPPSSTIPLSVVVDVPPMKKELEAQVPMRVAEEHDRSIGTPGLLTYTVDRSAFTLSMAGNALVASTDLTVHASICHPVIGLGCVQYGSCTPLLHVTATLPTTLTSDYALPPSTVAITVTRRCLMTALDIDVTSIVQSNADAQARRVKAQIDASLPKPKEQVARAWDLAQSMIPLGKGSCIRLQPRSLVQGPAKIVKDQLLARFAVVADPIVDAPCTDSPAKVALPKLGHDDTLAEGFSVHLAERISTARVEDEWKTRLSGVTLAAGPSSARVTNVAVHPAQKGLSIDAKIAGPTCGVVLFDATPIWNEKDHEVVLSPLTEIAGERDRIFLPAPILAVGALADSLRSKLVFSPPVDDVSLGQSLEDAKNLVTEKDREISLVIEKGGNEGVFTTPAGIELRFLVEGHAELRIHGKL